MDKLTELDVKNWELYHIAEDVRESHNLSAENCAKLIDRKENSVTWRFSPPGHSTTPLPYATRCVDCEGKAGIE